jgi:hypothetical protein
MNQDDAIIRLLTEPAASQIGRSVSAAAAR